MICVQLVVSSAIVLVLFLGSLARSSRTKFNVSLHFINAGAGPVVSKRRAYIVNWIPYISFTAAIGGIALVIGPILDFTTKHQNVKVSQSCNSVNSQFY